MRAARPAPLRVLLAAASALACASAAHGQAADEYRYGIPEGLDLAGLVSAPTLVRSEHGAFDDGASGERRSRGFAEVVAVYELPIGSLLEAASDFASYSRFLPRIIESTPAPPASGVAAREIGDASRSGTLAGGRAAAGSPTYPRPPPRFAYTSGIRIMGIEAFYRVVSEASVDDLGGGAFGVRGRMVESLDGKLYAQSSSFYFAPVTVEGRPMTFVRYYSSLGLRDPGALTVKVLSMSAGPEAKAQVKALAEEAKRRSRAGGIGG